MGRSEVTKSGVLNLEIDIQGSVDCWDFVVCNMKGYDLILGMGWLLANHAFLYCQLREH